MLMPIPSIADWGTKKVCHEGIVDRAPGRFTERSQTGQREWLGPCHLLGAGQVSA
jgi:hypothetical protein